MRQFPLPRTSQSKHAVIIACVLALSACSTAKKELGLTRESPDEFAVVERAPLEMPPDYALRPPQPGAPRPQEMRSPDTARTVVFGSDQPAAAASAAPAETILLQQAGANNAQPNIRQRVDSETAAETNTPASNKPVAERLLGWTGAVGGSDQPAASVVDPKAEAERLKQNQAQGKPVTAGETPTIKE